MAEGQDDPKKITITVKTPKEKQQVEIEEDSDIKKVSAAASCPLSDSWRNNTAIAHAISDDICIIIRQ